MQKELNFVGKKDGMCLRVESRCLWTYMPHCVAGVENVWECQCGTHSDWWGATNTIYTRSNTASKAGTCKGIQLLGYGAKIWILTGNI